MGNKERARLERMLRRFQGDIVKRKARLQELQRSYANAKTPASKSSFKGKITYQKGMIRSFEAKIRNIQKRLANK